MRTSIILLFLGAICLLNISARLPKSYSGVECQLSLIQSVPNQPFKGLAFSLSIINHSDEDLYVPGLIFGYGKVHLYEKDGDSLRELDLLNQDPKGGLFVHHPQDISRFFESDIKRNGSLQDSLLNHYCTVNHLSFKQWKLSNRHPLFIKAHSEIKNLSVYDMDFLLTPGKQYVFSFKAEKVEPEYKPENILGYTRYDQDQIMANTIYYETINP